MDERKSEHGWKIQPECTVRSFSDIISEQLAETLQREDVMRPSTITDNIATYELSDDKNTILDPQLENDRLIAQTLQREYNLEHDNYLRNAERIINGNQKVRTSIDNYILLPPDEPVFKNSEDLNDEDYGKGQIITKHDKEICERKNADRAMSLPTNLEVGDMMNCHLSHKAYNALKSLSKSEKRSAHLSKDKSQYSFSQIIMDPTTSYMLMNLIDRGILKEIGTCIATGKEATILYAEGGMYLNEPLDPQCALKVFHTVISEFKTRFKYIKDDFRFRNRMKSLNNRKMINLWTEKEFHNLKAMIRAGIPCPNPLFLRNNILVMTLIGDGSNAAPRLSEVKFETQENIQKAYEETLSIIRALYNYCNLVHADLSEYNLLWYHDHVYVLDVAQAVHTDNLDAFEYLYRDCTNISKFFSNLDIVSNADDIFEYVTGFCHHPNDAEYQNNIRNYSRTVRTMSAYLESTKQCDVPLTSQN
ncbi:hypothetical protein GJ496_000573 [Pomphorhynchus laevis]|nr:hypothetical protein GJ496_000573 [Pomphorhynchus laevis]